MSLFVVFLVSALSVSLVLKREDIPAFSGYEAIIESEIAPKAYEEKEKKESGKISHAEKTLKRFFGFSGTPQPKKEEATATPMAAEEKKEMLRSENVTIDKGVKVSNSTAYNVNPLNYAKEKLGFSLDFKGPQVLIVHTHTTECYSPLSYERGAPDRSLTESENMIAVGEAMREELEKNGISTIHDKTVHDYPSYNSAYQKAASTIQKNLKNHPSIKVVLDVHRDAVTRDDGSKLRLLTKNADAAQIMLVVGTNVNLQHDTWQENFKFASKIQVCAEEMYPSLMRPIDLREERFNQQYTKGSLIVEVGANGNTLAEATEGARNFALVVSKVLKEGK